MVKGDHYKCMNTLQHPPAATGDEENVPAFPTCPFALEPSLSVTRRCPEQHADESSYPSTDGQGAHLLAPPLLDRHGRLVRSGRRSMVPRGRTQRLLQLRRPLGVQAPQQGVLLLLPSTQLLIISVLIGPRSGRPPSSGRLMSPDSTSS